MIIPPNTTEFTYDNIVWHKMTNRLYYKSVGTKDELACNQLFHRYIWLKAGNTIPKGWVVHHIDNNPLNCNLLNLSCMPKLAHAQLHLVGKTHTAQHNQNISTAMKGNRNRATYGTDPTIVRKAVLARYINKMKRYFSA